MGTLFDWLQGLGALAGFASAFVLGVQHLTRDYPAAFIIGKGSDHAFDLSHHLRIKNPSDRPLIVTFRDNVSLNELRVWGDNKIASAVASAMGKPTRVIVEGKATLDFPIVRRGDMDSIEPDNMLVVRFFWRFAQPRWLAWNGDQRVEIRVRKQDYEALATTVQHLIDDEPWTEKRDVPHVP